LTAVLVHGAAADKVCYDRVGCFSKDFPFSERPINLLPESPDSINTMFMLFTRQSRTTGEPLDARHPYQFASKWQHYSNTRGTTVIIHGFMSEVKPGEWMYQMKDELLDNADFNVIIVDWTGGNGLPYTQATGNTRLVGAQLADLINTIAEKTDQLEADFHLVGHSLGAHVAGYAGERVIDQESMLPLLGRISGLDPAAPYFEGMRPVVRLDEKDANFVDVIHTDTESLGFDTLGLGMKQAVGRADYYPNKGYSQPACAGFLKNLQVRAAQGSNTSDETTTTPASATSVVDWLPRNHENMTAIVLIEQNALRARSILGLGCDHSMAIKYFLESINSNCRFTSYPCDTLEDVTGGSCHHLCDDPNPCGQMGFYADDVHIVTETPAKYFLTTGNKAPYCLM